MQTKNKGAKMLKKIKCFWVSHPEDGNREPYAIADIGESRARLIKLVEETPDPMVEE